MEEAPTNSSNKHNIHKNSFKIISYNIFSFPPGLYLYILVVKTFSADNIKFNTYALIGWGGPALFSLIWVISKGFTLPTDDGQVSVSVDVMSFILL